MYTVKKICCALVIGILAFDGIESQHSQADIQSNQAFPTFQEGMFQGDIMLTPEQEEELLGSNDSSCSSSPSQTGMLNTVSRWPKYLGKVWVPYSMNASANFSMEEAAIIMDGLKEIEKTTCVRFVKWDFQKDYVDMIRGKGCWSFIGKIGNRQSISLGSGCVYKIAISHEFTHALGFMHMHARYDRDDHINVKYENVESGYAYAFGKVDNVNYGDFNTSYDFYSVMHYGRSAFGINGSDTIVPKNISYIDIIGNNQFSVGDAQRINNMYDCKI